MWRLRELQAFAARRQREDGRILIEEHEAYDLGNAGAYNVGMSGVGKREVGLDII